MTEFKYCVYCEDEPAICFNTEADAMKFAREDTSMYNSVRVEKSEIDDAGEVLNTEVIWTASGNNVPEKEIVSDNEFETEFPESDIANIDTSDDIDYDELARQYAEDPSDWIDDNKLIKEAVDALEENEDEVECKICFELGPKAEMKKLDIGYVCPKCAQELHSHQGTNLDLIDSDPFSLDYEDPRDFDEPEEEEVKEEPVDENEVRKFEAGIEEKLDEHINDRPADVESDQVLQDTDNAVVDCKAAKVIAHSEDEKPLDCKMEKPALEKPLAGEEVDVKLNEELKVIIDFSEYKPWSGAVDTYELIKDADKLDELEAYLEECYPEGVSAGTINDILWFDSDEILKYLGLGDVEDEEVDEALTEDTLTKFAAVAPHPILYKLINNTYGNDGGFLITKRRKGKNESESAKKTNDIVNAIKFVKELAKNKDVAEIHLQIVKTAKDILIYKDGKETFNKIIEVGKNLQAENKTKVGGDTISTIDELRDNIKASLEKLFADEANNYREAEQEKIKEILQNYAKQLRACTTKDEINLLDAVNKAKTDISKLKTKAAYEAEEGTDKDTSSEKTLDKEPDEVTSASKLKVDDVIAALKTAYPDNDKQIRIVMAMLKKANLTEALDNKEIPWMMQQGEDGEPEYLGFAISLNDMIDRMVKDHRSDYIYENTYIDELDKDTYEYMKKDGDLSEDEIKELDKYFGITENLEEAKKEDELSVDPEAAKLEVHTMLNDLVADGIEAINGYEDAKAEIMDTPIAHKDNILDTIDHVEDEAKEHVDELIAATTEIPFDKKEASVVEKPFEQDFPEVEEDLEESAPDTPFDSDIKEGDKIRIIHLEGEDNSYDGKEGEVTNIDSIGQLHGTWGGLAVIPGVDDFDIITEDLTEAKAKPEGDKVQSYNNGLKLAKLHNKPVIYGYTNSSYGNKFFELDDPIICDNVSDETKKFRQQYKSCNVVYVAYPSGQLIERLLEELPEGTAEVDYVEYKHSYCHALEPKLEELKKIEDIEELKKAILDIINNDPQVNWTKKEKKFAATVRHKKWKSIEDLKAYLDNSIAKAREIKVSVDADGELVKKLTEEIEFDENGDEIFTPEEQEEFDCDEWGYSNKGYDQFHHCGWCGEIYPESEMRHEADFGWICSRCEDELKLHGGPLTFIED